MIGKIIQQKRKAAGLTQAQLAELLGVTAPAVNRWEKDLSFPDATLLAPLARCLNTDLNELFSFYDSLSEKERQLILDRAGELPAESKTFKRCHEFLAVLVIGRRGDVHAHEAVAARTGELHIRLGEHLQGVAHRIVCLRRVHRIEDGSQKRIQPVTVTVDIGREALQELRAADRCIVSVETVDAMECLDKARQFAFQQGLAI